MGNWLWESRDADGIGRDPVGPAGLPEGEPEAAGGLAAVIIAQVQGEAGEGRLADDEAIARRVEELLALRAGHWAPSRRARLAGEIRAEVMGYGPIQPYLDDAEVSEIMVNGPDVMYVERHGRLERVAARFRDGRHVAEIIRRIAARAGRKIDESTPLLDARIPELGNKRVNAVLPPVAVGAPILTIRSQTGGLSLARMIELGSLSPELAAFLARMVACRANILVAGGTGSGKTTLLNVLSGFIPDEERAVVIEDTAELRFDPDKHVVRLEARPVNLEGRGEISIRSLVKNALRMRPDRIVVGEVRDAAALDMLQAMNTGHDGSLTTAHANSCKQALDRVRVMALQTGEVSEAVVRDQVVSAFDLVVFVERLRGVRRVREVEEVLGVEGEAWRLRSLWQWEDGRGAHVMRGEPAGPVLTEKLSRYGSGGGQG